MRRRASESCDSLPRGLRWWHGWSMASSAMGGKYRCESCGMPIEAGPYCVHCVDESGRLQDFETRFARVVAWTIEKDPTLDRAEAEKKAITFMAGMPAWCDHPRISGRER